MSLETYGRYQLLKKLAVGGMAQIYLARQVGPEGFEKLLVVKRILPHLAENDDFITMFLDEARIAARLNHPNIVQIFDLGAQDDSYFIAMEFIHGEDVRRVWKHSEREGKPIPIALICRMIIDAAAGLDYAHKKPDQSGRPLNIVHRDISPQNILVSFEGGVKVVDFGIAKAADQATVTRSGVLKGKYSYMSPEQASGQQIDCRTDIFALGVVLYELLTGTRLFKRATDIQTLNAVSECQIAPPSQVHARVPIDLDAIVMKALTKNREDRYSEARQLGAALEHWLLSNKMPSSSAALAEFMHDVYRERLAREQEEGRLLIETADVSRGEELIPDRATPTGEFRGKAKRATQSQARPKRELEVTSAERGPGRTGSNSRKALERALDQRPAPQAQYPTEASMPTQGERKRGGAVFAVVAVAALLAVGAAGWAFMSNASSREALLQVVSEPAGAAVKSGGNVVCTTPCSRVVVAVGDTQLTFEKDGFKPQQRQVSFREGVQENLGLVTLEPLDPAEAAKPVEVIARTVVTVRFESTPPGAALSLNGQPVGTTPFSADFETSTLLTAELHLAGFSDLEDRFEVKDGAAPHRYTLVPTKLKQPNVVKPPVEVKPPVVAGRGTVRFVVKPWAVVECPQVRFKDQTPFADQQLPAGEFSCTFTNPDYPTQTRVVRVEANATTKVQVNFLQ